MHTYCINRCLYIQWHPLHIDLRFVDIFTYTSVTVYGCGATVLSSITTNNTNVLRNCKVIHGCPDYLDIFISHLCRLFIVTPAYVTCHNNNHLRTLTTIFNVSNIWTRICHKFDRKYHNFFYYIELEQINSKSVKALGNLICLSKTN